MDYKKDKYPRQKKARLNRAFNYAFKVLNLHTLFAQISPDNYASQSVIEKLGFTKEAHLKECYIYKGKFYDLLQYSKVNPWH